MFVCVFGVVMCNLGVGEDLVVVVMVFFYGCGVDVVFIMVLIKLSDLVS